MKFSQRAVIPAAREPLWDFLMDVPKVAQSLPGVESVSRIDDTTYQGTLKVRVGPISLNLQGKIILEEQDKERWRAALRAEANDRMAAGAVKGGLALSRGKLYFGDYAGKVYAIRRADGGLVWRTSTKGASFGLRAGQFVGPGDYLC